MASEDKKTVADDGEDMSADSDGADDQPMSFGIFVLSLNASTLIHLGQAEDRHGQGPIDLPLARQTIDILGMLEQKTRGNLSGEEERLLNDVLFDLRMRYTRASK
jgi:hypothetical protein